ncbi:MAG: right-handed parallel beta-helix repeat-containing protein [Candidatus Alcyoniella australis]|nr:right-handed parallel beta-helix repeat-containing protein [Candidatus Alcyoniella australis]
MKPQKKVRYHAIARRWFFIAPVVSVIVIFLLYLIVTAVAATNPQMPAWKLVNGLFNNDNYDEHLSHQRQFDDNDSVEGDEKIVPPEIDNRCENRDPNNYNITCVKPTPGMKITETTVFCPGEYDLSNTDEPGIVIESNNIGLYCDGTILRGRKDQAGIMLNGKNDFITGCVLHEFQTGIIGGGNGCKISEVKIYNPERRFIDLEGRDHPVEKAAICNSTFINEIGSGYGVDCLNCVDVTISENRYENQFPSVESPIAIMNSQKVLIRNNKIVSRGGAACNGIWLSETSHSIVEGNHVEMYGGEGSHIYKGENNWVTNNTYITHYDGSPQTQPDVIELGSEGSENVLVGNYFYYGRVSDEGSENVYCVDGVGNSYLAGATYHGPDPGQGTCRK